MSKRRESRLKRLKRRIRERLRGHREQPQEEPTEDSTEGKALTIEEIAETAGMFPSDVERACRALQEQGKVECWMADGKLYVIFIGDTDMDDLLVALPSLEKDNIMYG